MECLVSIRAPAFRPERHPIEAVAIYEAVFQSAPRPFDRSDWRG